MEEKVVIQQRPPKSPTAAGILSLFFLGAFYNGQIVKGIFYILIFAGLISIQDSPGGQPFKAFMLVGFILFQIFDSINSAKAINMAAAGEKSGKEARSDFLSEAETSGSIFWGAVLIILGFLMILANFEIILYETLFDFWPVAIIVIGLKLIAEYFAKAKNGD